jgi:hypothetical protein
MAADGENMALSRSTARTTVFCAVWNGDQDRHQLLLGHTETLRRQSAPIEMLYVFDNGDTPPAGTPGRHIVSRAPLTIYQAWNVAVRHATTDYVMNLNLDDRLAPDAVETMQDFADANQAGLIGGDWHIRFSQADTDDTKETYRASALPFAPGWPPPPGIDSRLGSGTGDRGTLGPATMWRRSLHDHAPYPWMFADGNPIRIVGDAAWWTVVGKHLGASIVRLPLVIGNYHSHPGDQAEFRGAGEQERLGSQGIQMSWYPSDGISVRTETP